MELSRRGRVRISVCVLVIVALLKVRAIASLIGFLFSVLWLVYDLVLARLAEWGIRKTPKEFTWKIRSICIRPSFWWSKRKSEIVVYDWQWLNPQAFKKYEYMIRIKKFVLEVDLFWGVWLALTKKKAISCDVLHIDGVEFHAERNPQDALNLWVALDLPDQDVNAVARYVRDNVQTTQSAGIPSMNITEYGNETEIPSDDTIRKKKFSPFSTRQATPSQEPPRNKKKKEETEKRDLMTPKDSQDLDSRPTCSSCFYFPYSSRRKKKKATQRENDTDEDVTPTTTENESWSRDPKLMRRDTAIDDPRRRPRWGVPLRFDIQRLLATKITVNVLDLLLVRSHALASYGESGGIRIDHVELSRELLIRPDPAVRKYGIYLGELVWALIHVLIKKIVKSKPTRLVTHSTLAVAFAMTDLAHYAVARTLELAINAPPTASRFTSAVTRSFPENFLSGASSQIEKQASTLRVRVLRGRRLAIVNGKEGAGYASTHVRLLLRERRGGDAVPNTNTSPTATVRPMTPINNLLLDQARSTVRLWTTTPSWNESFSLSPVADIHSVDLVIMVIHNRFWSPTQSHLGVGEVVVPLVSVFGGDSHAVLKRRHSNKSNEIVAWFRLVLPSDESLSLLDTLPPSDLGCDDGVTNLPNCDTTTHSDTRPLSTNDVLLPDAALSTDKSRRRSFVPSSTRGFTSILQQASTKKAMSLLLGEIKIGIQLNHLDKCAGLDLPAIRNSRQLSQQFSVKGLTKKYSFSRSSSAQTLRASGATTTLLGDDLLEDGIDFRLGTPPPRTNYSSLRHGGAPPAGTDSFLE